MPVRFSFPSASLLLFVLAVPALAGGRLADALSGSDDSQGATPPAIWALDAEPVATRDEVAFEATADYELVVTATRAPADDVAFEVTADYEVVVTATPLPAGEVASEATADPEVVVTAPSLPS